ncbi:MAG: DUF2158 domain-containing protein [Acidobacteria bacterium]|nr:DUF2158 domain-containing protein [Acidobacteriota bacterium]
MSSEQFNEGDLVQLKSGGPVMTVTKATGANSLTCKWFEGSSVHTDYFPPAALRKVPERADQATSVGAAAK